jgi:hypothetical protein
MADEFMSSDEFESKPTLAASRRNFLKGSRLILGAGLAAGAGLVSRSKPAQASNCPDPTQISCCFLRGTRIATPSGQVKIEELKIGDLVLTVTGGEKPVKWIGRRELTRDAAGSWAASMAPVKVAKFAIDRKAPRADLYVSPSHAIYIDGMLIPASNLVNGVTIVENATPGEGELSYFHIELDTHEAILAEGLAVESYLACGGDNFDNEDEYLALYGPRSEPMAPFAPIVSNNGGRQELASHIRSVVAPVYDIRKPLEKVRDRLADWAELARAA